MKYIELFLIDPQKKYYLKLKELTGQKKTSLQFLNNCLIYRLDIYWRNQNVIH